MESSVDSTKTKKISSKKKRKETSKSQESNKESSSVKCVVTNTPAVETTPAKVQESASERLTPNQSEECRMLEWIYQNRLRDTDQCVAWGSPQGSPTLRTGKKGSVGDPWSPISESHSAHRKPPRRIINASNGDLPDDFLSELTALSERVRAHEEELTKKSSRRENLSEEEVEKRDVEDDITILDDNGLTDTQVIKDGCELSSLPKMDLVHQIANESFSALFDDDDDLMNECMLKCSQEVEEQFQSELGGASEVNKVEMLVVTPHVSAAVSPRRRLPVVGQRISPRNTARTFQNMLGVAKQNSQTPKKKVPKVDDKRVQYIRVNGRLVGSPHKRTPVQKNTVRETVDTSSFVDSSVMGDDSFDAVLQTFMDEDTDLLSQALAENENSKVTTSVVQQPQQSTSKRSSPFRLKKVRNLHNAKPIHRFNSEELETCGNISLQLNGAHVSKSYPVLSKIQETTVRFATTMGDRSTVNLIERSYVGEVGQFGLQEDSSESSSISCSPPFQCTPEEIAKKKREAKLKLEKKKMSVASVVNKPAINQSNRQPLKPLMSKHMK